MATTTTSPQDDPLREQLRRLGCLRMAEVYPEILARAAREDLSMTETLRRLVEEETRARFERIVARRIKEANQLQAAQSDGTFLRRLRTYLTPDCLVLDELGYLPIDRHGADLLFQVSAAAMNADP